MNTFYPPYNYSGLNGAYSMPQPQPQQSNSGIIWVQGEAGAKSYLVAPNNTVMLMDSEGSRFYIKSTDNAGMPTMRIFEYKEITQTTPEPSKSDLAKPNIEVATKDDIEALKGQIEAIKAQLKKSKKGALEDEQQHD